MKSIVELLCELNCEVDEQIRAIFVRVFDKFERALIDGLAAKFRAKMSREDVSSLYSFSNFDFLILSFFFSQMFLTDARK